MWTIEGLGESDMTCSCGGPVTWRIGASFGAHGRCERCGLVRPKLPDHARIAFIHIGLGVTTYLASASPSA